MSVIGIDCSFAQDCNGCYESLCAGCGVEFIVWPDDEKLLCVSCTGNNTIWDFIKQTYEETEDTEEVLA